MGVNYGQRPYGVGVNLNGLVFLNDPGNFRFWDGTEYRNSVDLSHQSVSFSNVTNQDKYISFNSGIIEFANTAATTTESSMTAMVFFRQSGTNPNDWVRLFGKNGSTSQRTFGLWYNFTSTTLLYQRYGSSGSLGITSSISEWKTDNSWHCLTGVSDGTLHKFYYDYQLINSITSASSFYSSSTGLTIGGATNIHTKHLGDIGPTLLYNRGLSDKEVFQNLNAFNRRYGI